VLLLVKQLKEFGFLDLKQDRLLQKEPALVSKKREQNFAASIIDPPPIDIIKLIRFFFPNLIASKQSLNSGLEEKFLKWNI
jgi:hypothetical protein